MPPKQQQPTGKHSPGLFIALGCALGAAAIYLGLPGILLALVGVIVAAFQHPGFIPTGPKDKNTGQPTPLEHEKKQLAAYNYWRELKNSVIIPGASWMPGKDVQLSFLVALWAAALAWHLPTPGSSFLPEANEYIQQYGPWVNAISAFILIAPTSHLARKHYSLTDSSPGAPVSALVRMAKELPQKTIALSVAALIAALMLASLLDVIVNQFMPVSAGAVWALTITGSLMVFLGPAWRNHSLAHWRRILSARQEWENYWQYDKKVETVPQLVDITEVGPVIIHHYRTTFDNPFDTIFANFPSVSSKADHNLEIALVDVPQKDEQGEDIPGSINQLEFKVAIWPPNSAPDWEDPQVDLELLTLRANCGFYWAFASIPARPAVESLDLISLPDSPAIWQVNYHSRGFGGFDLREARGEIAGAFNAPVLVDHRANGGAGQLYTGAVSNGEADPDKIGRNRPLPQLEEEDRFNEYFIEAMGGSPNPPAPQFDPRISATLVNGAKVDMVPFVMRRSQTWEFYVDKIESKLVTAFDGATMCSIAGFPMENGRPGDRRPNAISVLYSYDLLPARPHEVQPNPAQRNAGEKIVLQHMVNEAFKATRLARPEVHRVTCLTKIPEQESTPGRGRGRYRGRRMGGIRRSSHIWRIDMRLYGGATLSDVRNIAVKLQESFGSPYMRVMETPDGCALVVGSNPADVTFASDREEEECMKLDWQHAWHSAKIMGNAGRVPQMTSLSTMEDNDLVSIIEFALPAPLDYQTVKNADKKLGAITGNEFVQVKRIPGNPSAVQVLCAVDSPIPSMAPYDWQTVKAEIAKKPCAPFATSMSGSMVTYDPMRDVHLMVVGGSGSGKSVTMQSLVTGALASGADIYVGDPTKGATDFFFMQQYAKAFAVTMIDTSAMMRGLYDEVRNRVALLAKHKVANIKDLPPEVRPNFVYLILDEFTGLVQQDKLPPKSDDPEAMAEYEDVKFNNLLKSDVGAMTGKIAREARSAGVTLILATQKLDAATLAPVPGGTTLKANMSRLIVGSTSLGDLQAALKNPYNAPSMDGDVPKGRGLFESAGASEPEMIQCYFEPGGQDQMGRYLAEVRRPLGEHEKLDLGLYRRVDPGARSFEEFEEEGADQQVIEIDAADLSFDDLDFSDFEDENGVGDLQSNEEEVLPAAVPATSPSLDHDDDDDDEDVVPNYEDYAQQPVQRSLLVQSLETPQQPSNPQVKFNEPEMPLIPETVTAAALTNTVLYVGDTGEFNSHCQTIKDMGMRLLKAQGQPLSPDGSSWEQLDFLTDWLSNNPSVRSVVWIDRAFKQRFDAEQLAKGAMRTLGIRHLPLGPSSEGVNEQMVNKVTAFNQTPETPW